MLLPVATEFDEESNTLFAETDELGTYCVLDMEVLMRNFGIEPDGVSTEIITPQMYLASAPDEDNTADTSDDKYNIIFIIDDRSSVISSEQYAAIKEQILEFAETIVVEKRDLKITIYKQSESNFFENCCKLAGSFEPKAYDYESIGELSSYIGSLSRSYLSDDDLFGENCIISDGLNMVIDCCGSDAQNYIFDIYAQENSVYYPQNVGSIQKAAEDKKVNVSIISDSVSLTGFQSELVNKTSGIVLDYNESFAGEIYSYIFDEDYEKKNIPTYKYGAEFEAILATGLQKVVLNSELYPNGKNPSGEDTDTDMDGLSDWDEVDFERWEKIGLITYDENNNVILPTIQECINFVKKHYVSGSLDRFKENYLFDMSLSDVEENYADKLSTKRVMPIYSDPTREDSDDDGYGDEQDLAPMTPFVNPIILLHGRNDNTYGAFGVATESSSSNACYGYETSVDYSSAEAHIITSVEFGKLGYYLINNSQYEENKNLFAFNYPNQDFAMRNGPRLSGYIDNIKKCVNGVADVPKRFLASQSDIFATKDDMKKGHARFILIGHSNGGLVSRYYIETMNGHLNVDKLITIDTPHMGASIGLLGGQIIPLSKLSTFTYFVGLDLEIATPLDAELRPNSSLFTGKETDYYSYGFGIYPFWVIAGRIALKNIFFASDELEYIQNNQSRKLTGNADVDRSKFRTQYYAIGGVSMGRVHGESFCNQLMVAEFVPNYNSKTDFNESIVETEKALYPNAISYPDISGSDNVVELSSQLGVRFDGDNITDCVVFKRMTVIAHDGNDDSVTEHYHGKILSEPRMHEVLKNYICDYDLGGVIYE